MGDSERFKTRLFFRRFGRMMVNNFQNIRVRFNFDDYLNGKFKNQWIRPGETR
jgi:hypothetical protein